MPRVKRAPACCWPRLTPIGACSRKLWIRASAPIDWPWLVERANAHKLGALLACRIADAGAPVTLPDAIVRKLDAIRAQAAIRATSAQRTLQEVAKAFAAENVDFLLVKGGVLAEHVYADPTLRPFDDIDVLVRDEALDGAERALRVDRVLARVPPLNTCVPRVWR